MSNQEKKYKYKIWLEAERIEVDADGKEIGSHEQGAMFGIEPVSMGSYNTMELTAAMMVSFSEYSPVSITDLNP